MNVSKCALVLAIACIVGGCSAAGAVKGSGTIKTEPREVNGFTGVELAGSAKLIVQQGEERHFERRIGVGHTGAGCREALIFDVADADS